MPLEVEVDKYRGVTIAPQSIPCDPDAFAAELESSLVSWSSAGYRLAWLTLPLERAELIPVATTRGFHFHHTAADSLMLTRRLSSDSFVPPFASHYVGAGGVVLTPDDEILMVVERYGPSNYKLPGGLIEAGEEISEGVRREVWEETGVETEFESLLAVTHSPRWNFGRASLYLVCLLRPLSRLIEPQEAEIAEARWMPRSEFMSSQRASPFTRDILGASLGRDGLRFNSFESVTSKSTWELFLPGSQD